MRKVKREPFDPAELLITQEAMAIYVPEALQTGSAAFLADTLDVTACADDMARNARQAGTDRC